MTVVRLDPQVNFIGLPSPVGLGKGDTFLLVVFYFETAIPKTCQNRISFTFTRWLQSLLPLSHWFKTITEVVESYSQCLFSGCWLQSSTQWILHKQMPHQLVCPGIFAGIWIRGAWRLTPGLC